jgi:hypothetical protein
MDALYELLCNAVCEIDINKSAAEYYKQHSELLIIPNFLSPDIVKTYFLPEVEVCVNYINRVNVRGFKKSGSVSFQNLRQHAPNLFQLYISGIIKQFISQIVGKTLHFCPAEDSHAAALYFYTDPGDHIKVHYDKSFYRGQRYTVLLGLIQDSIHSKLICYPGATKINRKKNPLHVYTHPGTLVIFNGDGLWHEVSPLGENERRVILTMEFLTDIRMTAMNKFISDFKDRFLYFGKVAR